MRLRNTSDRCQELFAMLRTTSGKHNLKHFIIRFQVKEGSIAEQQGLKVGDVIVRINEDSTRPLTHAEAHVVISNCGNQFFFGIHREEPLEDGQCSMEFIPITSPPRSPLPDQIFEPNNKSPDFIVEEEIEEKKDGVEEEIAALMSGEAEILKEHNVIGVNFNRIFPKPGVCMSSEVLKELNDEAIKTKQDKVNEQRKWTTFLQKPDRPIPKSKQQLEQEARAANAYKVKIIIPSREPSPRPKTPEVSFMSFFLQNFPFSLSTARAT